MSHAGDLVVVAHPDDEVIFFGGLIAERVAAGRRVDVLSATGVFGDRRLTSARRAEFRRACWRLGAHAEMLGFRDAAGSLPLRSLSKALGTIAGTREYGAVYTHGVWGEYGHQHHRDVCAAVHRAFDSRVLSLAGPFKARHHQVLSEAALEEKRRIARMHHSQPFAADWCTREEALTQLSAECVEVLYAIGNGEGPGAAGPGVLGSCPAVSLSLDAFEQGSGFAEVEQIPREIWEPAHRVFAARLRACGGIGRRWGDRPDGRTADPKRPKSIAHPTE